jgi:hypothetical protein
MIYDKQIVREFVLNATASTTSFHALPLYSTVVASNVVIAPIEVLQIFACFAGSCYFCRIILGVTPSIRLK